MRHAVDGAIAGEALQLQNHLSRLRRQSMPPLSARVPGSIRERAERGAIENVSHPSARPLPSCLFPLSRNISSEPGTGHCANVRRAAPFWTMMAAVRLLVSILYLAAGCGPVFRTTVPEAATAKTDAEIVNATVWTNGCQDLGRARAQKAERAMNDLVEGCTTIPGRAAQFEATLEPSGRIVISAAPGQLDVVPICVLKHSLVHQVPLSKPCHLKVRMQESTVSIGRENGASPP
ncbi:MAG: hypothetical protein ABSC94_15070 [Polyangiaceae bacterium]